MHLTVMEYTRRKNPISHKVFLPRIQPSCHSKQLKHPGGGKIQKNPFSHQDTTILSSPSKIKISETGFWKHQKNPFSEQDTTSQSPSKNKISRHTGSRETPEKIESLVSIQPRNKISRLESLSAYLLTM